MNIKLLQIAALLHDAGRRGEGKAYNVDCLDIKRVRKVFEEKYLDFYQDVAKNNRKAFQELAHLIAEVRSILEFREIIMI